jgi:hypothetical protein
MVTRQVRNRRGWIRAAVAAGFAAALLAAVATAAPIARAGVAKGIVDAALERQPADSPALSSMIHEIDRQLGARWSRISVSWAVLEEKRGTYAPAELERLDALIKGLHAAGVKVFLTVAGTPAWAQDPRLWQRPPAGHATGPQPFYPVRPHAIDDFGRLAEHLARRYKGQVQALECWNEPNLWSYIYPQRTASDKHFAARSYLRLLRAFHAGVRRADARMRVIAGATAPVGLNDVYRTSPQRFARFLRRAGASRHFEVYSHHPYTPGGSQNPAPGQPPNDGSTAVTLYNLRTLLRVFPRKPFFITEYGYGTVPTQAFGGFAVSETEQARYLKQAYRLCAVYPQVKLLVWFLLRDQAPPGDPGSQVFSGLRRVNGERKPSWYAFRAL